LQLAEWFPEEWMCYGTLKAALLVEFKTIALEKFARLIQPPEDDEDDASVLKQSSFLQLVMPLLGDAHSELFTYLSRFTNRILRARKLKNAQYTFTLWSNQAKRVRI